MSEEILGELQEGKPSDELRVRIYVLYIVGREMLAIVFGKVGGVGV